jgi:DNA repair protein RecO (recombination protein O)
VLYRVEAIVIRSTDYGEGNKIITLFTESYGKIGVMARAAKKLNSRFAAVSQLFTCGEFVFYRTGQQLGSLNYADAIVSHQRLREDIYLSAYASYMAEMTDRLTGEQDPQPYLYRQFKLALDSLTDGKDPQILTHLYEMKILAVAGYAPNLDNCVSCGETSSNPVISNELGGVLCPSCAHKDREAIHIGDQILKLLRLFAQVDLARLGKIELRPETKATLRSVMRSWMDTHVGIRWRTLQVIEQLERYDV